MNELIVCGKRQRRGSRARDSNNLWYLFSVRNENCGLTEFNKLNILTPLNNNAKTEVEGDRDKEDSRGDSDHVLVP